MTNSGYWKDDASRAGELYCDRRLVGVEIWHYGKPKDANMRIPDTLLQTVCFLCVKVPFEGAVYDHFIGTAFFVVVDSSYYPHRETVSEGYSALKHTYLATAAHVLKETEKEGYKEFYVRLNKRDGGSQIVPVPAPDEWEYPDNKAVDIAVVPFSPDPRVFEYFSIPIANFVTEETIYSDNYLIGIGDELLVIGLFLSRGGIRRNIPVVRSGILSAMPTELFVQEMDEEDEEPFRYYHAYLAEIKSISGLSGSPVFIVFPPDRMELANYIVPSMRPKPREGWETMLLGLVRGHWNVGRDEAEDTSTSEDIEAFNAGIAKVTPIKEAHDIIFGEKFMKKRAEDEKRHRQQRAETLDSATPPARAKNEGVITKEGFEDALRRASRKVPESQSKDSDK